MRNNSLKIYELVWKHLKIFGKDLGIIWKCFIVIVIVIVIIIMKVREGEVGWQQAVVISLQSILYLHCHQVI